MRIECIYNENDRLNITVGKEYEVVRTQHDYKQPIRFLVKNDIGLHYYYNESCFFISHWSIVDKLIYPFERLRIKLRDRYYKSLNK